MPSTTNRAYSVPTTGSQSGIWGSDDLNPNFEKIDKNLGAVSSVALSSSNVTLVAAEYNCGTIKFTGTLSANVTVTFPTVAGWWTIINATTGNFYIRLSCSVGGLKICPPPGQTIDVCFDATDAYYRSPPHHIGEYWDYGGSSVPVWVSGCSVPPYLLVDGSTYSAVTYPYLNTILGTTTLIDQRNRVRVPMNGSRLTTAGCGIDGTVRFAAGGVQSVVLDATMIPSHTHTATSTSSSTDAGHTHNVGNAGVAGLSGSGNNLLLNTSDTKVTTTGTANITTTTTTTNANTGGGLLHTNQPPTVVHGITMIRAA